jgi:hypothetical protein
MPPLPTVSARRSEGIRRAVAGDQPDYRAAAVPARGDPRWPIAAALAWSGRQRTRDVATRAFRELPGVADLSARCRASRCSRPRSAAPARHVELSRWRHRPGETTVDALSVVLRERTLRPNLHPPPRRSRPDTPRHRVRHPRREYILNLWLATRRDGFDGVVQWAPPRPPHSDRCGVLCNFTGGQGLIRERHTAGPLTSGSQVKDRYDLPTCSDSTRNPRRSAPDREPDQSRQWFDAYRARAGPHAL